MNSLYDLSNDYAWLLSLLYDEDADEQTLIDTLDSIEGAIDDKAENYAKIIKDLEKSAENIGEEITRLRARQQAVKNRAEWLKGNLYSAMKAVGKTKIKGDIFTVSIQKNGGAAPLRVLVEAEDLPDELRKVKYEADKTALRELAEKGDTRFAVIEERGESLRIK